MGQVVTADVVRYPGRGVEVWRLGGDLPRLGATPPAFRRFVGRYLDRQWREVGARPACRHSALVTVKVYDTRRYARFSNAGMFAHAGDPASCNAGGHAAIAAHWRGRWREVLGTQEGFYNCPDLRRYRVPRTVAGGRCYDAQFDLVPYRPHA